MKGKHLNRDARKAFVNYGLVIVFYLVIQILLSGGHLGRAFSGQLVPICVYMVMAISLNLVVGISGELSLGHAGFMSVGAFSGVIAAAGLRDMIGADPVLLAVSMLIGALFASVAGLLIGIPVLRLRGDYLAIVTLAFGEIIKNVMNVLYVGLDQKGLHFGIESAAALGLDETGQLLVNGPIGAMSSYRLASFVAGIILVLITLVVIQHLIRSRSGRAIMAIRDNRIAAEASGLNVTKYKMMAFVVSAAFAGAAGALYGMNIATVVAKKFDFNTSILILVFVVLGGLGNIRGSMIAAALLTVLPEMLRQFNDYRMLIYAIVLILVMLISNNDQAKALKAKFVVWLDGLIVGVRPKKKGGAGDE